MIEILVQPFLDNTFMLRALLALILIAASAGPLGFFLHARGLSLAADTMSHSILPGVAIAYILFGLEVLPMTAAGVIVGLAIFYLALWLHQKIHFSESSLLAVLYILSLSSGVLLIGQFGTQVDLLHFLLGNPLTLSDEAIYQVGGLSLLSVICLIVYWKKFLIIHTDRPLSLALGLPAPRLERVFLLLVCLQLVLGFYVVGSLLSIGLLLTPSLTSRLLIRGVERQMMLSVVIGATASWLGLVTAYHYDTQPGPTVALILAGTFFIAAIPKLGSNNWPKRKGAKPSNHPPEGRLT